MYKNKYLKYKAKYINLKNQIGSASFATASSDDDWELDYDQSTLLDEYYIKQGYPSNRLGQSLFYNTKNNKMEVISELLEDKQADIKYNIEATDKILNSKNANIVQSQQKYLEIKQKTEELRQEELRQEELRKQRNEELRQLREQEIIDRQREIEEREKQQQLEERERQKQLEEQARYMELRQKASEAKESLSALQNGCKKFNGNREECIDNDCFYNNGNNKCFPKKKHTDYLEKQIKEYRDSPMAIEERKTNARAEKDALYAKCTQYHGNEQLCRSKKCYYNRHSNKCFPQKRDMDRIQRVLNE